ncbi:hypothetical protein PVAG01_05427 [Phlyctema vagabunda]|uniref:Uncharacterized protein n=1 Tax=Phlyctema vagabunda TaxID=108571 RepID=A0ABR4PK49_9HELO
MPLKRTGKAVAIKPPPARASKLPSVLRFPLLVTLSLTFSSLLYSFSAQVLQTEGELAAVSRRLDQWWEVGALLGWRAAELALGWWGGYDSFDLSALAVLSHGPPLYLLKTFYGISNTAVISSLAIDAITLAVPMHLLRPLSPGHSSDFPLPPVERGILSSIPIQILMTLLGTVIYSTTLYGSYASFLPTSLVTYFEGIPTIAPAHTARPETLFPTMLLMGVAAKSFIFTPATATLPSIADAKAGAFNPETATLSGTVLHNIWGFSPRTRTIIKRTVTLMLASGINTFVQTLVTVNGSEAKGAAAYSSVWPIAALFTGIAFGVVGDV